jgi:plastocyanin
MRATRLPRILCEPDAKRRDAPHRASRPRTGARPRDDPAATWEGRNMKAITMIRMAPALIAAAALVGAGCSKDSNSNPGSPGPAADVTIEIVANNATNSFSPNPEIMTAGKTVAWHNAHSETHTATADDGSFTTGDIAPEGTSQPIKMNSAGAFSYHCARHPTMVAVLTVNP